MMMKTTKNIPWKSMLTVTAILSSCTGSDQTLSPLDLADPKICAELQVFRTKDISSSGVTFDDVAYVALFSDDSRFSIDGGTVTVNGRAVTKHSLSAGAVYQSTSSDGSSAPDTVPYRHDGGSYVFSISGNDRFTAYTDSIASPKEELSVAYPTAHDTISRAAGCAVKWNGVSADEAHVVISDTISAVGHQGFGKAMSDNGSMVISSHDLAGIQPGPITIMVTRGNYAIAHAPDGRNLSMSAFSMVTVHAWLKP